MKIDLEAIEALDTVIRLGGMTQAAAHLHKAQSAVSYQIRKLESALGVTLLDRAGYRVQLTEAGRIILSEGRRLLDQARHVQSLGRQLAEGWEPRLLLILDGILPLEPALAALKSIADENIPTRIQMKIEFLWGVQHRFEADMADLMLVKDFQPNPYLRAISLPDIECVLCVARQHALAQATHPLSLAELQQYIELTVQDSSGRGDENNLFGGERVFFLSGFMAKKQALLMGLGFGWMPLYMIEAELAAGSLCEVAYSGASRYRFTPHIVYRGDQNLGPAARRLVDLLAACRV